MAVKMRGPDTQTCSSSCSPPTWRVEHHERASAEVCCNVWAASAASLWLLLRQQRSPEPVSHRNRQRHRCGSRSLINISSRLEEGVFLLSPEITLLLLQSSITHLHGIIYSLWDLRGASFHPMKSERYPNVCMRVSAMEGGVGAQGMKAVSIAIQILQLWIFSSVRKQVPKSRQSFNRGRN